MNICTAVAVALMALGPVAAAQADESAVHLKDAPEAATVTAYCSICHSIDYVLMNSPFMKKAGWDAEVRKMMKAFGAPVPEEEAARIIDYLARNYGVE
jgi:sulfite dehydrogenase (cytochrome) subunit B